MSSVFTTPLGDIWVSNGQAEAILDGCIKVAERQGLSGPVVEFLREHMTTSGMGCYGFNIECPPFDEPAHRVLLSQLIAELTNVAAAGGLRELVDVPWDELAFWIQVDWLASLELLHDGIRASLPMGMIPTLQVKLDTHYRDAIDVHRLLVRTTPLRILRDGQLAEDRIRSEIELRRQAIRILDRLPEDLQAAFGDELRAEVDVLEGRREHSR